MYLEKAFEYTGWRPTARLAAARDLGETSLAFLVYLTPTGAEVVQDVRGR